MGRSPWYVASKRSRWYIRRPVVCASPRGRHSEFVVSEVAGIHIVISWLDIMDTSHYIMDDACGFHRSRPARPRIITRIINMINEEELTGEMRGDFTELRVLINGEFVDILSLIAANTSGVNGIQSGGGVGA